MANDKDFKVKNGIKPTAYYEAVGTVVSGSEAYSLATASYDGVSFSVAAQETAPTGLFFKPDGTKMYVIGSAGDDINEYNLSTAWDVSTATYSQVSSSLGEALPTDIFFKPDGTKVYFTGASTLDAVYEWDLSTAWDISTATSNQSFSVATEDTNPQGLFFKPDGTKMYVLGRAGNDVNEYSLSTAWDVSTATYTQNFSHSSQETTGTSLALDSSGTKMVISGASGDPDLHLYTLNTAWDISTASHTISVNISQDANPVGITFKPDGTKMYMVGNTNDTIYQYSTVLYTETLDLSTGSVFEITPTSDIQVFLSNPAASGTVSGATLLLDGVDPSGVSSVFSTDLYTGTGSTQTITNGIDLAGEGGMVWIKGRNAVSDHALVDTERGGANSLASNTTAVQRTDGAYGVTFNSDGFDSTGGNLNVSGRNQVSWSFRKSPRWFDCVTYTGNGTTQTINHSLNCEVGAIFVKRLDAISNWPVYHRSALGMDLNRNIGSSTLSAAFLWGDNTIHIPPTSTNFTIGSNSYVNASGGTFVAYLFAHDPSGIISAGTYTGNGSTTGTVVNLGWEPQWLLIKRTDSTGDWNLIDNVRGFTISGTDAELNANLSDAESTGTFVSPTSSGFQLNTTDVQYNANTGTYSYIAIRDSSVATITYDPTIQWAGGTAPTSPAIGDKDVLTFTTRDGGTTYNAALAIDGAQ